jgi:hypothetical protein
MVLRRDLMLLIVLWILPLHSLDVALSAFLYHM